MTYGEVNYGEEAGGNPSGTFAATLPVVTASFSGDYHPHESGTFAATLPHPLTAAFTGTYTPPVNPTGDFAATLPVVTASFSGTYTPGLETGSFAAVLPMVTAAFVGENGTQSGSFAAVLPLLTARFSGEYGGPYPTDTSNSEDGLDLIAVGVVTMTRPVAAPPASLVLAQKFDKAVAYPTPDMNNGRPE